MPPGWQHDYGNLPEPEQWNGPEVGHSHDWEFHEAYGYHGKGYYSKTKYPKEEEQGEANIAHPHLGWQNLGNPDEPETSHGHFSTGYKNPWSHVKSHIWSSLPETGAEGGSSDS